MDEHYLLTCPVCKKQFSDTYLLTCKTGCFSLLRADYSAKSLTLRNLPGIFKYRDWLPVMGSLPTCSSPICFKSSMLAAHLGLKNLWIGFSGYWPLRDAYVNTGSFKEFEAYPTVVRLRERTSGVILVSSAGNTGRAFAQVSAETDQPVIIVVPVSARERIWTTLPAKNLLLITVDGDYTDAITLGNALCSIPGIYSEGGAKNVARRDGMGTVMLEGAVTIGKMPDWYIQGVGSGTGGIAAWEASIRLIKDGRFGSDLPRLLLIQNEPFIPMVRAWQAGRREIIPDLDMPDAKGAISQVYSDVLTNRAPPYAIPGGVYDALSETGGLMDSVSSEAAREAGALFHRLEGIDPDPAAAVCVAGFIKAVHNQVIDPKATILLSITGGGYEIINQDMRIVHPPDIKVENVLNEQCTNSIKRQVTTWVSQYV